MNQHKQVSNIFLSENNKLQYNTYSNRTFMEEYTRQYCIFITAYISKRTESLKELTVVLELERLFLDNNSKTTTA